MTRIIDDLGMAGYLAGRYTRFTEQLGKLLLERDPALQQKIAEKLGVDVQTVREDLAMSGNTVLYTTAVAGIIDQALRPQLVAQNVIKKLDMKGQKGINSVKIPRNTLITATELTENTDISYGTNNYDGVTITAKWVGAAQKFSEQLLRASAVDVIKDQLQLIGYAIGKKIDEDIIAALQTAAPTDNSNGNYVKTGDNGSGSAADISYEKFIDAVETAKTNNAEPDVMLMHPSDWAALMKDTDFKNALAFATTPAGAVMPQVQEAAGIRIITSSVVTQGNAFIIDSKKLGYYVDFTETVTYDGRIPDQISFEVIGAKAYGVGISQPQAYVRLHKSL